MADSLPPRPQPAVSLPPRPQPAVSLPPRPQPAVSLPPRPSPADGMADSLPPEPAAETESTCFDGCIGFFKIVTLIFGLFSVGLTADSYQYNLTGGNPMETSYLAIVIIIFIASVIRFLLLDVHNPVSDLSKNIDVQFHAVAGLFLIGSAAVWFVSVNRHFVNGTYEPLVGGDINFNRRRADDETVKSHNDNYNTERLAAGVFGMMNGVVYIIIAICLC